MRLTLFGFNALALFLLVAPAFLIFTSLHGAGMGLASFLGVFGLGSAAALGGMARLSLKRVANPERGVVLLSFGVILLTVGFAWLFLASL
jgi:hypothetical protein